MTYSLELILILLEKLSQDPYNFFMVVRSFTEFEKLLYLLDMSPKVY